MKAAVILSGCGFKLGAEVSEVVFFLTALEELNCHFSVFAQDHKPRFDTGSAESLVDQAARISREASPLSTLDPASFDFLVIPGGFGVLLQFFDLSGVEKKMNLKTGELNFAMNEVEPFSELCDPIQAFYRAKKPIVTSCLGPLIVAAALRGEASLTTTFGSDEKGHLALTKMGHYPKEAAIDEVIIDRDNKLISTPAFFAGSSRPRIFAATKRAVRAALALIAGEGSDCLPCRLGSVTLTEEQVRSRLPEMPGWKIHGHELVKVFSFSGFKQPLELVTLIGELAEELGHHPDIELSYGKLAVRLSTHKVKGITESDLKMAEKIDIINSRSLP